MRLYAFLKAVNVGGSSSVDLKALAAALEGRGFPGALSFLASGNLTVETRAGPQALKSALGDLLTSEFGLDTAVAVIDRAGLEAVLAGMPFGPGEPDESHRLAYLFASPPKSDGLRILEGDPRITEPRWFRGEVLYVYYPAGIGRSRLTTAAVDKAFGAPSTGRNLRTLARLLALG